MWIKLKQWESHVLTKNRQRRFQISKWILNQLTDELGLNG